MRQEALAEQDFASSGRTAQGTKTPVNGQMTPAQILVKGAITHVQDTGRSGGGVSVRGRDTKGRFFCILMPGPLY
jgi:curli biogenesis system outer membrane secretion channel CsgG